MARSSLQA
jgi:hypothetical protein